MFSFFAVYVKWHVVCGPNRKKVGAKIYRTISTLALFAVFVLLQNMKEHGSNLQELISDKRGAMLVT
jgi:hypothetical protein